MAYAISQDENDRLKAALGSSATLGTPSASAPAAAAAPAPAGTVPGKSTGGSKFVNFDRYLGANQATAQNTANKLAGQVEGAGQGASGALGQAQSSFAGQMSSWTDDGKHLTTPQSVAPPTPSADGIVTQRGPGLQRGGGLTRDEAVARSARTEYTGPNSLSDVDAGLSKQISDAASQANQISTQEGRQALLSKGKTNYGAGSSRFDAALTGAVGGGQFKELQKKYGGLGQKFLDADTAAQAQATQAKANAPGMASIYASEVADYDKVTGENAAEVQRQQNEAAAAARAQQVAEENAKYQSDRTNTDHLRVIDDEEWASRDGRLSEWEADGKPPYGQWKEQKGYR